MLPKEQIQRIKKQLVQQIEKTFPQDKKASAIEKIKGMSEEELIQFLKQNNLIKTDQINQTKNTSKTQDQPQCIFCSIVNNQSPSYKINENKSAIAVLEINPITKGHTIIIPKKHIPSQDKMPEKAFSLAKKTSKKLKKILSPKDVKINFTNMFGHEIINVIPVYKDQGLNSKRKKASEEDLKEMQSKFKPKPKPKKREKPKKEKRKKMLLPKRIP